MAERIFTFFGDEEEMCKHFTNALKELKMNAKIEEAPASSVIQKIFHVHVEYSEEHGQTNDGIGWMFHGFVAGFRAGRIEGSRK